MQLYQYSGIEQICSHLNYISIKSSYEFIFGITNYADKLRNFTDLFLFKIICNVKCNNRVWTIQVCGSLWNLPVLDFFPTKPQKPYTDTMVASHQ